MTIPPNLSGRWRALRVPADTAARWSAALDTAVAFRLTLQVPSSPLARAGRRLGGAADDATSWFLQREAKRATLRRDSEARRVAATLTRLGATQVRHGIQPIDDTPWVEATATPRIILEAHRLVGPVLDRVEPRRG